MLDKAKDIHALISVVCLNSVRSGVLARHRARHQAEAEVIVPASSGATGSCKKDTAWNSSALPPCARLDVGFGAEKAITKVIGSFAKDTCPVRSDLRACISREPKT
jgi:hypothetical protein